MIVPSAAFLKSSSLAQAAMAWEIWREIADDPAEARRVRFLKEWEELKSREPHPPRQRRHFARRCGDGLVRTGEWLRSWSEAEAPPRTA